MGNPESPQHGRYSRCETEDTQTITGKKDLTSYQYVVALVNGKEFVFPLDIWRVEVTTNANCSGFVINVFSRKTKEIFYGFPSTSILYYRKMEAV